MARCIALQAQRTSWPQRAATGCWSYSRKTGDIARGGAAANQERWLPLLRTFLQHDLVLGVASVGKGIRTRTAVLGVTRPILALTQCLLLSASSRHLQPAWSLGHQGRCPILRGYCPPFLKLEPAGRADASAGLRLALGQGYVLEQAACWTYFGETGKIKYHRRVLKARGK